MAKRNPTPAWIACALSGALLVPAFAPFDWAWCGWIALVPAWLVLRLSPEVQKRPLRYGYLTGLLYTGGCFWWIAAATPPGFLFMLAVLSGYPALWFLLVARLLPATASGPLRLPALAKTTLLAAAFWVALEWLRAWFCTGFNWNELGVSQTPLLHLRQLAALGGVPLLSFVLVVANILIAEAVRPWFHAGQNRSASWRPAVIAAFLPAASWLYGWQHLRSEENHPPRHLLRYLCIQPNVPEIPYAAGDMSVIAPLEVDSFQKEEALTLGALGDAPDLLIWPEAITTQRLFVDPLIDRTVGEITRRFPGDFLLGAEEMEDGRLYNDAFLLTGPTAAAQKYRKVHLVVLGEYLPGDTLFPWLRQVWGAGLSFTPGLAPARFTLGDGRTTFSPFICYEDTQPAAAADAARLQPDFFITVTNDSWYAGATAEWMLKQHLQNALLRCVEHDRPMLRCANNGITCAIDADGSVAARVRNETGETTDVSGVLSGTLALRPVRETLFESWGDWVSALCRVATASAGILYLARTKFP